MLFIIGVVCFIIAICLIIYNTPKDKNVLENILDAGDKYIDKIKINAETHPVEKIKLPEFKGEISCPKSRGRDAGGKNERRCRRILEKIYGEHFPSVRPEWLKNPGTGYSLELDCYCHKLRIALEYDGDQHRKTGKFNNHNPKELLYQIRKDQFKNERCKQLGITLIRVPDYIKPPLMEEYIMGKLKEVGKLPKK
jgi:hypothetical protein